MPKLPPSRRDSFATKSRSSRTLRSASSAGNDLLDLSAMDNLHISSSGADFLSTSASVSKAGSLGGTTDFLSTSTSQQAANPFDLLGGGGNATTTTAPSQRQGSLSSNTTSAFSSTGGG